MEMHSANENKEHLLQSDDDDDGIKEIRDVQRQLIICTGCKKLGQGHTEVSKSF